MKSGVNRKLSKFRDTKELNNLVMNYMFVNGYAKSFEQMSALVGGAEGFKLLANNKEKLETQEVTGRTSFAERQSMHEIPWGEDDGRGVERRDSEVGRRDSEVGRRDSDMGRRDSDIGPPILARRSRNSEVAPPRKQSLVRIKTAMAKENEDVKKIINFRGRGLIRSPANGTLGRRQRLFGRLAGDGWV